MSAKPVSRLCQMIAAVLTFAIASSAIASTQKPVEEIDEIWVQGERLSKSIVDVEDDFFKLYNKVNKKQDYDIYCGYMSLNRGSMIMTRVCMPAFVTYNMPSVTGFARSYSFASAGGSCGQVSDGTIYSSGGCTASYYSTPYVPPSPPTGLLLMERRADYAQNVLDVINSDQRLLQKYMHLIGLYEDMRQTQGRYRAALGSGDKAVRATAVRIKGPRTP
jgi:hypothetical protein